MNKIKSLITLIITILVAVPTFIFGVHSLTNPTAKVDPNVSYVQENFDITYDLNGGTVNGSTDNFIQTYNANQPCTLMLNGTDDNQVSKTNYELDGWKATSVSGDWTLDTTYLPGQQLSNIRGNVTLQAQWSIETSWSARIDNTLGGLVLTNYNKMETEITIPSTLTLRQLENNSEFDQNSLDTQYTVVGIEGIPASFTPCFDNHANIISVTVPNTIKYIGPGAFAFLGCTNPQEAISGQDPEFSHEVEVDFEENSQLKTIDGISFAVSSITSINLPDSVEHLNAYYVSDFDMSVGAFHFCLNLKSVHMPDSLITIGDMSFSYCFGLKEITIPENVKTIGTMAFCGTIELETINFNAISADDLIDVEKIKETGEYGPTKDSFNLAGSETDGITLKFGNSVERIPSGLFFTLDVNNGPNIKEALFGNSVKSIGFLAFWYTPLQSISMSDSLVEIETWAFVCVDLQTVTIPANVKVAANAFATLNNLTTINFNATNMDDLTENMGLFDYDYSTDETWVEEVTLTIGDNVTRIPAYFLHKRMDGIVYPPKVVSIIIGNGVQSIGDYAFSNVKHIENVYYHDTIEHRYNTLTTIGTDNDYLTNAKWWYYNEDTSTTVGGNYWYYDQNGNIVTFTVEADFDGELDNDLGGVVLTRYYGTASNLTIPSKIKIKDLNNASDFEESIQNTEYTVVGVDGDVANLQTFIKNVEAITSVTIPNTVKYIGPAAFALTACTNAEGVLTELDYPEYTTTGYTVNFEENSQLAILGPGAFAMSGLTSISLPEGITSLDPLPFGEDYAGVFDYCYMLKSITLPNSLATIGESAFRYCMALKEITIPENVTTLGNYAFYGTVALEEINFNAKDVKLFEGTIDNPTNVKENVFYLSGREGNGITVTFGENVTEIPAGLFAISTTNYPYIKKVITGNKVTTIGAVAFAYCQKLETVVFGESVEIIGEMAFAGAKILTLTIPDNVIEIKNSAFYGCGIETLTIGKGVTTIEKIAFHSNTSLTKIYFNATSMNDVESCVFYYEPEDFPDIEISVIIGDNVTKIPANIFSNENITSVVIGNSVATIGEKAFNRCQKLTNVYYHGTQAQKTATLTTISTGNDCLSTAQWWYYTEQIETETPGNYWYYNDQKEIVTYTVVADWDARLDNNLGGLVLTSYNGSNTNVTIPSALKIKDLNNASLFDASVQETEYTVVGIEGDMTNYVPCFKNYADIKSIKVPASIKYVGPAAFAFLACTNPQEALQGSFPEFSHTVAITFEQNSQLTTIEGVSFAVSAITSIDLPDSVEQLNAYYVSDFDMSVGAFHMCTELESIKMPESLTKIGDMTFSYCIYLKSITIPENVTTIGSRAFYYTLSLETINFNATAVADFAKYVDNNIAMDYQDVFAKAGTSGNGITITFGDNVTNVPGGLFLASNIFTDYANVKSIVLGNQITKIGDISFLFYTGTSIELPDTLREIGVMAFAFSALTSLTIPEGVTNIGMGAFSYSSNLQTIYYNTPNLSNLTSDSDVFSGIGSSSNPATIFIGDNITRIPAYLFEGSGNISTILIESSVVEIEDYAFSSCNGLVKVYYNGTLEDRINKITSIGTNNDKLNNATWYYYNEDTTCQDTGYYWYYDNTGNIVTFAVTSVWQAKLNDTSDGLIITKYTGNETNVTIPSSFKVSHLANVNSFAIEFQNQTLNVVGLEGTDENNPAFALAASLTRVTFPSTITSIGKYSFYGCRNLTNISLPENLTTVGVYAFGRCSGLTALTIPNSVTKIGTGAFSYCSALISLTIGEGVTSIGDYAFRETTALETINFNAINCADLASYNRVFANAGQSGQGITVTFGDIVKHIPARLFRPFDGSTVNIVNIKTLTIGEGVTSIGDYAFSDTTALETINFNATNMNDLTSNNSVFYYAGQSGNGITVNFGDSATKVPGYLFHCNSLGANAKLIFVNLNKVQIIGNYAFAGCIDFTTITVPTSVTSIENYAFYRCYRLIEATNLSSHITGLTLGGTNNGYLAYYAKHIRTSESDPSYLSTVSDYTWYQDDTKQEYYLVNYTGSETILTLPNKTPNSKNYTIRATFVENRNITQITIPDTVTQIDDYSFYNCSNLQSVDFGNNITRIGSRAFTNCSKLKNVVIPNSVQTIENTAFYFCSSLEYVVLGNSVQSIISQAFDDCSSLINVYYYGTEEHKNATLTTIGASSDELTKAQWWYYNEDTTTEDAGNYWYYNNEGKIVCFVVGSSWSAKLNDTSDGLIITKHISNNTEVTLPLTLKISDLANASDFAEELQNQTFNIVGLEGAENSPVFLNIITSVTISNPTISIGLYSFLGCSNLKNISLPSNTTTIGYGAFYNCTSLTSITIPEGVTSIGEKAFYNTALTEINFNATNCADLDYFNYAFYLIQSNEITVTFGDNVTRIPANLFMHGIQITTVILGNSVTTIGDYAFSNGSSLTTVYYHGTKAQKSSTLKSIGSYNYCLNTANWYYYNEDTTTTVSGKYWYYDENDEIVTFTVA